MVRTTGVKVGFHFHRVTGPNCLGSLTIRNLTECTAEEELEFVLSYLFSEMGHNQLDRNLIWEGQVPSNIIQILEDVSLPLFHVIKSYLDLC